MALSDQKSLRRAEYLIANPHIGSTSFGAYKGEPLYSNCYGTTIFLFGVEKDLMRSLKSEQKGDIVFFVHPSKLEEYAVFPVPFNRPGEGNGKFMEWFFSNCCMEIGAPQIGSIMAVGGIVTPAGEDTDIKVGMDLIHTAFVNGVNGKVSLVEQPNEAAHYRQIYLDDYLRRYQNITKVRWYNCFL